ncbi:MAG: guanylate kinase [Bacteroidales bacterium]
MKGKLVIISAPSGAGKTTIVQHLLGLDLGLEFSVSATTRQKRENEKHGKDYYFLSIDEFRAGIAADKFVEWQEVYENHYYGTLKSELDRIWKAGHHVLFDVDVKGGINLKNIFGAEAVSVFIMPPSVAELEKRLVARATDSPGKIQMRVKKASGEIELAKYFDRTVINDKLDKAISEVVDIISAFINN